MGRSRARIAAHRGPYTHRTGAALLEAMVALTILAVAGMWAVAMANQSADAIRRVREADAETRRASGFLDAVALWPREDLDRHLGDRREGEWVLSVERPALSLYTIVLSTAPDSAAGRPIGRVLLSTALFRPEGPDASR
jgi:type II secretory pathway component PulK